MMGPTGTVLDSMGGTSFTDPTAVNGTRYDYVVRGVNAGGESNDSNEASATPAAGVPPLPQGTGNGLAAVYFLCGVFEKTKSIDLECGALYHAAHALARYRQRRFGPKDYFEVNP